MGLKLSPCLHQGSTSLGLLSASDLVWQCVLGDVGLLWWAALVWKSLAQLSLGGIISFYITPSSLHSASVVIWQLSPTLFPPHFFFTDVSPNKILAPLIPFGLLLLIRSSLTKASYACIVLYSLQRIVTYICAFDLSRVLWGKRGRSSYTHFTSLEIEARRDQMLYLWCATSKMAPNNPCLRVFTSLCIPGGRE